MKTKAIRPRRGATAVEFALVAPAFFTLVAVSVACGSLIMSQNVMTSAALDGARQAALPDVSSGEVLKIVDARLSRGGLPPHRFQTTIIPSNPASAAPGSQVQVVIKAAAGDLSWIQFGSLGLDFDVVAEMSYRKE